jgi:hypothetical protein
MKVTKTRRGRTTEYPSILDMLSHSVVSFAPQPDGSVEVIEVCDYHFYVSLTPSEIRGLAEELIELAGEAEAKKETEARMDRIQAVFAHEMVKRPAATKP